jgi:hypothetical protein
LRNNPLLTAKAKSSKEQELIARQQQLREQVRKVETGNEAGERRLQSYFSGLKNCDP